MAIRLTFDYLAGRAERRGFTLDRIDRGRRSAVGRRARYELIDDDGHDFPCATLREINALLDKHVAFGKAMARLEANDDAPDCRERTIFPSTE